MFFVGKAFILLLIFVLASSTGARAITIHMTADRFSPEQLLVEKNTVITFVNDDKNAHWPASNPHPIHNLYPGFDPKKEIPPKSSWEFKATNVGYWRYHDHLNPHRGGVLVVRGGEPTKSMGKKILSFVSLTLAPLKYLLFSPEKRFTVNVKTFTTVPTSEQLSLLGKMMAANGGKATWEFLITTYTNNPGTTGQVHDLAHFVGSMLYQKEGFAGISVCTPAFAFGCYHGFLDTAFTKGLSKLSDAEKACQAVGPVGSGPNASCVHGIGHGVASYYHVNDIKQALASCEKLKNGQDYCYDGVFMEFSRNAPSYFYSSAVPLYPCTSLPEKYAMSCGRNQPTVFFQRFRYSYPQAAASCLQTQSEGIKNGCVDALGFNAVYATNGDPEGVTKFCSAIPDPVYYAGCITAAAGELIFQSMPQWQTNAPKICEQLSESDRQGCVTHLQKIIADYKR